MITTTTMVLLLLMMVVVVVVLMMRRRRRHCEGRTLLIGRVLSEGEVPVWSRDTYNIVVSADCPRYGLRSTKYRRRTRARNQLKHSPPISFPIIFLLPLSELNETNIMDSNGGKKKKRKSDHSDKESKKKSKTERKSSSSISTSNRATKSQAHTTTPPTTTNNDISPNNRNRASNPAPTIPPAAPVRITTTTPSNENPILVSFPGGLPQALQGTTSQKGPVFSWRKEGSSLHSHHSKSSKSRRFRLVGKDATCVYQSEITVPSTTIAADSNQDDKRKDTSSSKSNATTSPSKSVTADTTAPSARHNNYSQWCVGLYDKRRQTLTLYPTAPQGQVLTLQQSVPTYQPVTTSSTQNGGIITSAMDRRRLLTQDFGSSKQKKAMQSQQDNLVNVDAVVGGSRFLQQIMPTNANDDDDEADGQPNNASGMTMSASNRRAIQEQRDRQAGNTDVKITDPAEEGYDQVRRQYLPAYNKNAKEAIKVYRAKDILEDDEEAWSQIIRVVDACRKQDDVVAALTRPPAQRKADEDGNDDEDEEEAQPKKPVKGAPWNASVVAALKRLSHNSNDDDQDTERYQMQCAYLLNHLMNFYLRNAHRKFIREPIEERAYWWECSVPQALARRFVNSYTIVRDEEGSNANSAASYVMSPQKRDKCLLHILLLNMIVQGGRSMKVTNLQPLVQDLKIDVAIATKLLRMAGCTIVQGKPSGDAKKNTATTVQLQVPLTFPPPAQRRRRRKT